ncbi:unnamed protein product [Aphis gossypii]|uniref:Uncharacterized protein n=1 Tax=Aphis gossypii TaxID=80765 RepID=A0A9P0J5W7_APHGO|nr:unnamed protein product [Aphis gossypii]
MSAAFYIDLGAGTRLADGRRSGPTPHRVPTDPEKYFTHAPPPNPAVVPAAYANPLLPHPPPDHHHHRRRSGNRLPPPPSARGNQAMEHTVTSSVAAHTLPNRAATRNASHAARGSRPAARRDYVVIRKYIVRDIQFYLYNSVIFFFIFMYAKIKNSFFPSSKS